MKRFLHNLELKMVFQLIVGIVIVLLVAITALGTKQYFLYKHCRQTVFLSNQLLFGFTSIKEHISETLLTGGKVDLQEISREIQGFDGQIKKIGDDILIPEELKASFISQVDMVSLVVQLRAVQGSEQPSPEKMATLAASLRSVSGRLLKFHEVLSAYTQSLLLGLHRVVVGTLALVVFVVCSMLFFMHRYISEPILKLYRSIRNVMYRDDEAQGSSSIKASIADLSRLVKDTAAEKQRLDNLLVTLGNVGDTLPDNINDAEFWETMCLALQTNPDYLLVWVGITAHGDEEPSPITGCGCVSSSPVHCKQAINHLITYCREEGSLCDSARQAVEGKKFVVATIPMSSMPDTLRSALPFKKKMFLSASFPVMHEDNLLAVVTLYSPTPHCFEKNETDILQFFFQQVGKRPAESVKDFLADSLIGAGVGVYRYSVVGALAAGLAHEMVNTTNGALNYSQALLDLLADEPSLVEERSLLEKLHQEEFKSAGLTGELTRLVEKSDSTSEKIQMVLLLERAVRLLRGQFKQDGIQVVIDAEQHLPPVTVPVQDVLIILLTLLQRAAGHVNRSSARSGRKIITAVIRAEKNNKSLSLAIDNCPAAMGGMQKKNDESPWPDLSVCSLMMQQIGGTFETEESGTPARMCCTISLPIA
jgi:hypothetical protein